MVERIGGRGGWHGRMDLRQGRMDLGQGCHRLVAW